MADDKRDIEKQEPDVTFKKAALHQFFSTPVWHAIDELLTSQETIMLLHLSSPQIDDIKDIMFYKGVLNQIQYMKNIELTLEEK